jgi:hypothetical protein
MSTSTAVSGVSSEEGKGVEIKKEEVAATATVTEVKKEAAAAVAAAAVEDEGECDCEECQGGIVEYEEEGGWIGELGVDEHDFY